MTKHEYICKVCDVVREKSDCFKRKVGAVFVNSDYEILATGYNAPPRGFPHCDAVESEITPGFKEISCTCGEPCSRNIHAEVNAMVQAAKRGTALEGSILYCTYLPCRDCARVLVNLRVSAIFVKDNNENGGLKILQAAHIPVQQWG